MTKEADKVRAIFAAMLESSALQHGDARFSQAANILLSEKRPGRPNMDDDKHLHEMGYLIATGVASNPYRAASIIAGKLMGKQSTQATVTRLCRKYRNFGQNN